MKRVGVFIGVDRTGNAPALNDAAAGARRMAQWAMRQGMVATVLTDEDGKRVEVGDVTKAIFDLVAENPQQLLVYFAGHGINIGRSERWLLSGAPVDANAAVNLNASVEVARQGGVEHVVFISDACRTAAEGLQAQSVAGSIIFPNQAGAGAEKAVDQFWATLVGDPSHEIKVATDAAGRYKALYTEAILDALDGKIAGVVEDLPPDGVVRPWPLKRFLSDDMKNRIKAAGLGLSVIQVPDARITSEPGAWLSRIPRPAASRRVRTMGPGPEAAPAPRTTRNFIKVAPGAPADDLESVAHTLIDSALVGAPLLDSHLERIRAHAGPFKAMADEVDLARSPAGTDHFETECGFKIRGARVARASARAGAPQVLGDELVRMSHVPHPGLSVLLELDSGHGVVLPAIPGFVGALTMSDGDLVDVAYEPSSQTERWNQFKQGAEKIRALRGIAASATKSGVFRLDGDNALRVAQEMQYAKGIDPSLAVYAAYAYVDIRRRERVRQMSGYMRSDLGFRIFDIAMLARELDDKAPAQDAALLPFFPMLTQGWALLGAYRLKVPGWFGPLERSLSSSVWTLFEPAGVPVLRNVILSGEVR